MSKYVSYTMKALEYSKLCTEEQTREKEMSVTALLSHSNWLEIFYIKIILFGHKDKTLSGHQLSTVSHYLKVFIPKIKNEGTNEVNMLSIFKR